MAMETKGDTEKRMLAVMLKSVDGETLRQWVETHAAEDESFCQKTFEYLRGRCMPEMMSPDAWREKVDEIFEAECTQHRHRYSRVNKDWHKIAKDMEKLFDWLAVMEVKEAFRVIHAAVTEFYGQMDWDDMRHYHDDAAACLMDASMKGQDLLLKAMRSDDVPLDWKRTVPENIEEIRDLTDCIPDEYFGLEAFIAQLEVALLPDEEAVVRLDELIAEEPAWAAEPYLSEKARLLRKMGREEES